MGALFPQNFIKWADVALLSSPALLPSFKFLSVMTYSILLQVVGVEKAHTLTETIALHMRAKQTCIDALGKKRLGIIFYQTSVKLS